MKTIQLILSFVFLGGCLGMPDSIEPVKPFELDRYAGKWYEIARLDHSFESGLSHVTAEYTQRTDGGVAVLNRGFAATENAWQQAEGKAYFVSSSDEGYLKVSFFGPFYGSYVIFELEPTNYQYAFVSGPNLDYLWLLARTPAVSTEVIEKFISMSEELGFDTRNLIFVEQKETEQEI